jgi:integrase
MVNPHIGLPRCLGLWAETEPRSEKAMAKKRAPKRRAWNKGLEVGKRDGFTPDQVKRIRGLLADRGVPGLRDLALFSTAIDTMLHGQDLLALAVGDVQRRDGSIRPVIEVARARGMPPVRCALSNASTKALEKWITASDQIAKNSKRKEDLNQLRCGRVSRKVRSLNSEEIAKVARKVAVALRTRSGQKLSNFWPLGTAMAFAPSSCVYRGP